MKISLDIDLKTSNNAEIDIDKLEIVAVAKQGNRAAIVLHGKKDKKSYFYSALTDYDGIVFSIQPHKTIQEALVRFNMMAINF